MQKLSTYIRRLFQALTFVTATSAAAACAFEPASEEAREELPAGELAQALQGCGVETINRWAEPDSGGMIAVAFFKNLGASPCAFRWQFEVKKNTVSHYSPVYPSASTWTTLQPNAQHNHSYLFSGVTSPCLIRTWVKMGSTWYTESYVPCF